MKKNIFKIAVALISFLITTNLYAYCPFEFQYGDKTYCVDLEWTQGQKRIKGQYQESQEQSPYLNFLSVRPELWTYSRAYIYLWEKGVGQTPVYVDKVKFFPFMVMKEGHSHGAKSHLEYDVQNNRYILSQMAFQEMKEGCWQLRLKVENQEDFVLLDITDFANLTPEQNYDQSVMCSVCSTIEPSSSETSSEPHHH